MEKIQIVKFQSYYEAAARAVWSWGVFRVTYANDLPDSAISIQIIDLSKEEVFLVIRVLLDWTENQKNALVFPEEVFCDPYECRVSLHWPIAED